MHSFYQIPVNVIGILSDLSCSDTASNPKRKQHKQPRLAQREPGEVFKSFASFHLSPGLTGRVWIILM
jgi:hypothetical protein